MEDEDQAIVRRVTLVHLPQAQNKFFEPELNLSRWSTATASMAVALCSGTGFVFSVYSDFMQDELNWNQRNIDNLAIAKDAGVVFGGIMGGIIATLFGFRATLVVGGIINFGGFVLTAAAVDGKIANQDMLIYFYQFIALAGNSVCETMAVLMLVNFSYNKGYQSGLIKGYIGLGSAVFMQVYKSMFLNNELAFILFIGWFPMLVAFACAPFFQVMLHPRVPSGSREGALYHKATTETFKLAVAFFLSILLALLLMSVWENEDGDTEHWVYFFHLAVT
ncbi:hypothetical protein CYMTET_53334, partial [Cymbomonas tetramitiformis]